MQVTISDLAAEPEQYDGHRVVALRAAGFLMMGALAGLPHSGGTVSTSPYPFEGRASLSSLVGLASTRDGTRQEFTIMYD